MLSAPIETSHVGIVFLPHIVGGNLLKFVDDVKDTRLGSGTNQKMNVVSLFFVYFHNLNRPIFRYRRCLFHARYDRLGNRTEQSLPVFCGQYDVITNLKLLMVAPLVSIFLHYMYIYFRILQIFSSSRTCAC